MHGGPPLAELLDGCAILEGEQLTTAFGHLSVALEDRTVLVSGNMGPGLVQGPEDFLHVSLDGTLLEGEPRLIPGELAVHLGLLRAGWASVARFHGPAVLAWGSLNRPLPATIGLAMFCGAAVPCYDTPRNLTRIAEGEALAAHADGGPAVILRGFGAATAGRSIREAVTRAWMLEQGARATLAAAAAGRPAAYDDEATAPFLAADGPAAAQIERLWHYLRRKHTASAAA